MTFGKKTLLAGTIVAALAGGGAFAFAAGAPHYDHMMGRMQDHQEFCKGSGPMGAPMVERLEKAIKPTDAQKPELDALKAALTKAQEGLKSTCPKDGEVADLSPPGRLASMEKHLTAMLEAVKTIRPAADALYAKLDDKQRDALRWAMPFGEGHRGGHHSNHHPMMDDGSKPAQ